MWLRAGEPNSWVPHTRWVWLACLPTSSSHWTTASPKTLTTRSKNILTRESARNQLVTVSLCGWCPEKHFTELTELNFVMRLSLFEGSPVLWVKGKTKRNPKLPKPDPTSKKTNPCDNTHLKTSITPNLGTRTTYPDKLADGLVWTFGEVPFSYGFKRYRGSNPKATDEGLPHMCTYIYIYISP